MKPKDREKRMWWVVLDGYLPVQRQGLSCHDPDGVIQQGVWWFPDIGYSMHEGYQIFPTEAQARAKAISDTEEKIFGLQNLLAKLKA
jgi:hypothetical protein